VDGCGYLCDVCDPCLSAPGEIYPLPGGSVARLCVVHFNLLRWLAQRDPVVLELAQLNVQLQADVAAGRVADARQDLKEVRDAGIAADVLIRGWMRQLRRGDDLAAMTAGGDELTDIGLSYREVSEVLQRQENLAGDGSRLAVDAHGGV
jgi:uncharacterized protein YjiS (DUF1127 family)